MDARGISRTDSVREASAHRRGGRGQERQETRQEIVIPHRALYLFMQSLKLTFLLSINLWPDYELF